MSAPGKKLEGGCYCGGVRYEFELPVGQVLGCHCSICRRTIGCDYATVVAVNRQSFKFTKKETFAEYSTSEDLKRGFCNKCGCSLTFIHFNHEPHTNWLTLASVDEGHGIGIDAHIFAGSKGAWVQIPSGVAQSDDEALWTADSAKRADQ